MQKNLRILSGFYGLLRPFDKILPYRLEMGTKLQNSRGKNLYEFWGNKITDLLNKDFESEKDIVINLASEEYYKSINNKNLNNKVITPVFKEYKMDPIKQLQFMLRKSLMSRYIIDNEIDNSDGLKTFTNEGYSYDESLSDNLNYVFTR